MTRKQKWVLLAAVFIGYWLSIAMGVIMIYHDEWAKAGVFGIAAVILDNWGDRIGRGL